MVRSSLSIILSLCLVSQAAADDRPADAFPLRNHNPFLQVFGLPAFRTAELVAPGGMDFELTLDIANDADGAVLPDEVLLIDGETRTLKLSLRRRFGERFEVGLDLPYVEHTGGFFDSIIYEFHDVFGFSNGGREGPDDQVRIAYVRDGTTQFDLNSTVSGIGDTQLTAAMSFNKLTLRAGVKLPTGDANKLTGSGATDLSLGVHGGGTTSLFDRPLAWSGFAGILVLGEGDVLREWQKDAVPYGGVALRWHATERVSLGTQLAVQGPYFDVGPRELGGRSSQLGFGADFRFPQRGFLLRLAIAEDIAGDAAPDFALHLSVRRYSR